MTTKEKVPNLRYGLHIWTYLGTKNPVYYCRGILGQYIISIPNENIIIVRTGGRRLSNIVKSENKYKDEIIDFIKEKNEISNREIKELIEFFPNKFKDYYKEVETLLR
mgnify:CR=1 FL=1